MSIVIDEDDDLMIVDNNIQTVYTDDKKENYRNYPADAKASFRGSFDPISAWGEHRVEDDPYHAPHCYDRAALII